MAYSNLSQLRMLRRRPAPARASGASARSRWPSAWARPRSSSTRSTTSARPSSAGRPTGAAKLERSLALADRLEEHVARARTNLGVGATSQRREYALADPHLEAGIAYCRERDLDAWLLYMLGWQARSQLEQGRWDAAADARA